MSDSVIFNETFTSDKPIYYPSTWGTGKTALQNYQQFKLTWTFWVLRNSMECIIAFGWLFIIYVILQSFRQIYRISKLPEGSREKLANRKYLEKGFLASAGFVAFVVLGSTLGLGSIHAWLRYALLKGMILWLIVLVLKWIWGKLKRKNPKNQYQPLKDHNQ